MAIVLRFVDDNNEVCEHLLCKGQESKFDAVSLTDTMLEYLQQYGVRTDRMLAANCIICKYIYIKMLTLFSLNSLTYTTKLSFHFRVELINDLVIVIKLHIRRKILKSQM